MSQLQNTFTCMGTSDHSDTERVGNDYYTTDPLAIDLLEKYGLLKGGTYWECACGNGKLSEQLKKYGYDVVSSDLYDYGYGTVGVDFLKCKDKFEGNILTNPPFRQSTEFIEKGLQLASKRLYIFGRLQLLESQKRWKRIFRNAPPIWVCPFVKRIHCYPNNEPNLHRSAISYAWFIWDKEDDSNETKVKWLI